MGNVMTEEGRERLGLVRDSAASIIPRETGAERARLLRFHPPGFDTDLWKEMCGLGWAGLRVSEAYGGAGLDTTALCAIAQQLGASLSPEPFISSTAVAQVLSGDWLDAVLTGKRIVVPAWMERPHDLSFGQTCVDSGRVNGTKRQVLHAEVADAFVVATPEGLALVKRDAPGVSITPTTLHDGSFAGDVQFNNAPGLSLQGHFDTLLEECALANAAYLLGTMETLFDTTLAYLAMRKQFGKPIGSFQALQHRAVDLKIQMELTRAVVNEAAAALDGKLGAQQDRHALVSRAKVRAGNTGMLVSREAIQFHGAMGITDECDIGLYARKILSIHNDWGSVLAHRQRFTTIEQVRHD